MSKRQRVGNLWRTLLGLLITAVHLIPFYILIGVAFKSRTDVSSRWVLPNYLTFENFQIAIEKGKILTGMLNATIITGCSIALIVVVGAMAAYPLSRNTSRLNKGVMTFVLGVMMVPPLSILVPLYTLMAQVKATSTYWGIILILVAFQLPTSIFLYRNFISSIPRSLDEAAEIDGCSNLGIFFRIILPQLKAVTASVIIMTGVACWNDYQFSLYMLQKTNMRTVTLAVASFFSQTSSNLNAAAAAGLLGILPIVVLYVFLQKYFIRGMVDSAIK